MNYMVPLGTNPRHSLPPLRIHKLQVPVDRHTHIHIRTYVIVLCTSRRSDVARNQTAVVPMLDHMLGIMADRIPQIAVKSSWSFFFITKTLVVLMEETSCGA